jgi:deoxyribonuclease (pyrimidine dimer)
MTRINVGVCPSELNDLMLRAEHREIKRIPNVIKSGRFSMHGQPEHFKLGTGHVKFFYDKIGYLAKRYEALYSECVKRGFKMTYFGDCFENIPPEYMGDYSPQPRDREIILERITERLNAIEEKKKNKKNN